MVAIAAEHDVGGSVKGATHYPPAGTGGQLAGSMQHFLGCSPGEGQEQDGFRFDALANEVGHPMDERPGFSGSSAGNDQNRSFAVGYSGMLAGVERCVGSNGWVRLAT